MGLGTVTTMVGVKLSKEDDDALVADLRKTLAPRVLGIQRLGRGGMGMVFAARDASLKRDVAIKVLAPEFSDQLDARTRFLREAQAVAAVAHPNVVPIYQVGELDGSRTPYFVMQLVTGATLDEQFPPGTHAPEAAARRVVAEVGAALAAAHARGLVHRDIKPANIMIDADTGRAIVLDFGISALLTPDAKKDEKLTATGVYMGTPRYTSPEQAAGERLTDKSDVYALGCVAFEILAGKPVFEADSIIGLFAAHLRDAPESTAKLRPDLDPELSGLVDSCLAKDPAMRPTAKVIADRLTLGSSTPLEWPPPGLESLHRRLRSVTALYWTGSALMTATIFPMVIAGPRLPAATESAATLMLLLLGLSGAVLIGEAIRRTVILGRRASAAVRSGYAWRTLTEVLADIDGETGALITGARRFAVLTAIQRNQLRRARILRAAALLIGGLWPIPALVAVFADASVLGTPLAVSVAVVLVPLASLVASSRLELSEKRLAPPRRRRSQGIRSMLVARAPSWYEAFEAARAGQALGAGSRLFAPLGSIVAGGLALVVVLATIVTVTLSTIASLAAAGLPKERPTSNIAIEKVKPVEFARRFALPKDSSISPTAAGTAFYALTFARPRGREFGFQWLPRPPRPMRPWDSLSMPVNSFPDPKRDLTGYPFPASILKAVGRGLTPAELAYLKFLAEAPHWRDWDFFARAPAVDIVGAQLSLPFGPDATYWGLPLLIRSSDKEYAGAGVSRAAYHLAMGRRDSAEYALRSTISAGFVIMDHASWMIEQLVGAAIVGSGVAALTQFYGITGNPIAGLLMAQHDSALAARDQVLNPQREEVTMPPSSLTGPMIRAQAMSLFQRKDASRALRMRNLGILRVSQCANLRELVFGPDPDLREAFAIARRDLTRFPSDAAVFDLMEQIPERSGGIGNLARDVSWRGRVVLGAAALTSTLLHNRRVRGCAEYAVASTLP